MSSDTRPQPLEVREAPATWSARGPAPARQRRKSERAEAVVSSKGQVTLPAAMRAQLGIEPGSRIQFEVRGHELVIKPEPPISAYYGILKGYDLGDIEPEKEPDREFD